MANAWKRDKPTQFYQSKTICLLITSTLLFLTFFVYLTNQPSNPNPNPNPNLFFKTQFPFYPIPPFDCLKCPQSHPVIANLVEGLKYPFLYSLSDLGTLPDKPHKNIVRMLKGKLFRKPDISVTIQEVLGKLKTSGERGNGLVVDVGANVGMASFAAAAMGFRVLAFEPVFENLQRVCDGIYFNRVGDLVTVFNAAASDQNGNITFHKVCCYVQVLCFWE